MASQARRRKVSDARHPVLYGHAVPEPGRGALMRLVEGGEVHGIQTAACGEVAIAVCPWEIPPKPIAVEPRNLASNRPAAVVSSLGSRTKVGPALPQPFSTGAGR